jgi:hypothetical protein
VRSNSLYQGEGDDDDSSIICQVVGELCQQHVRPKKLVAHKTSVDATVLSFFLVHTCFCCWGVCSNGVTEDDGVRLIPLNKRPTHSETSRGVEPLCTHFAQSISSRAQYVTLAKMFFTSKFSYLLLLCNRIYNTETGITNMWRTDY